MISKPSATESFVYITLPGEISWYETVRASGVSQKDAEIIRGAFVYPGFSL